MPGLPRYLEASTSIVVLVIASPVILLAGILIRLTSPGPVFFRQTRIGRHGDSFSLCKLRTMKVSASGPQITAANDSRVTWIGRLLRRTKVDELPELWNVFKGDLSLVGPRPEVPRYVDMKNPLWKRVLQARPGVTDPVTLKLRNEEILLARVGGDREEYYLKVLQPFKLQGYVDYLDRRSCWTDVEVLWKTLVAVLLPRVAPPPSNAEIEDV